MSAENLERSAERIPATMGPARYVSSATPRTLDSPMTSSYAAIHSSTRDAPKVLGRKARVPPSL